MTTEPTKLRIIFMGTSEFSAGILESLVEAKYDIIGVFTQPDKKAGREQKINPSAVKETAQKHALSVFDPEALDEETVRKVEEMKPDMLIVVAYGKILPEKIITIPKFGAINVHASLLPKYRGSSPIQNAILKGESETGITIMLIDKGVDTGDILSQKSLGIGKDELFPELSSRLQKLSSELLLETLPLWAEKKISPRKQNNAEATLSQMIERSDGRIIWSGEALEIYNKYRAFQPWPGIFSFWEREERLLRVKLNRIRINEEDFGEKKHVGEVFLADGHIAVQTHKGSVILEEIQMEGKGSVPAQEFINGYPDFIGSVLK